MKRLMLAAMVAMLVLGLASWARAEGLFKDDAKKDEPGAKAAAPAAGQAEPAVAPAKDLLSAAVKKRIDDKVALAEKMLQAAKDELAKPEGKADLKNADGYKIRAYGFYIGAMLEARKAAASAKKDDKAAISEQFEKPNKEKAIEILLALGDATAAKKDIKSAVAYYRQVLSIDPENVTAKDKLKALAEEAARANAKDPKGTGSKGGSDSTNRYDPSKGPDGSRTGVPKHPGDYTGGAGHY
jgi:tetratricopeptide (TPR) repeat protein